MILNIIISILVYGLIGILTAKLANVAEKSDHGKDLDDAHQLSLMVMWPMFYIFLIRVMFNKDKK
jgi:hypothetical protein